jgi:hypothetical protein
MEQSTFREANRCSANQEIFCISWNRKVYYHVHKSLPLVPILRKMNPFNTVTHCSLRFILILFSHLYLFLPSGHFPSSFFFFFSLKIMYAFLITPIWVKCSAYLIICDLVTLIIFGEASHYSLLQPLSFSFLGPNIFHSIILFLNFINLLHQNPQFAFFP